MNLLYNRVDKTGALEMPDSLHDSKLWNGFELSVPIILKMTHRFVSV